MEIKNCVVISSNFETAEVFTFSTEEKAREWMKNDFEQYIATEEKEGV